MDDSAFSTGIFLRMILSSDLLKKPELTLMSGAGNGRVARQGVQTQTACRLRLLLPTLRAVQQFDEFYGEVFVFGGELLEASAKEEGCIRVVFAPAL